MKRHPQKALFVLPARHAKFDVEGEMLFLHVWPVLDPEDAALLLDEKDPVRPVRRPRNGHAAVKLDSRKGVDRFNVGKGRLLKKAQKDIIIIL